MAIDIGALFGGAIITEKVYVWHGMGEYLNMALGAEDTYAVAGWVMVDGDLRRRVQPAGGPALRRPRSPDPVGVTGPENELT